jgi:hypothetical protein
MDHPRVSQARLSSQALVNQLMDGLAKASNSVLGFGFSARNTKQKLQGWQPSASPTLRRNSGNSNIYQRQRCGALANEVWGEDNE